MLRVQEVKSRAELDALRAPWTELALRAPGAEIFQTWEWLASWLDCFHEGLPIAFLFVWNGDRLAAVAPLVHQVSTPTDCSDSLVFPLNPHARRGDVLCDDDPEAVLGAIVAYLGEGPKRRRLALHQIPEDSAIARAVGPVSTRTGLATMKTSGGACPIVRLEGTWEAYLDARPGQVARELRRKLRKLEREYGPRWSVATTPAEAERALQDVWAIERASWKEEEGTSLTAQQGAVRLYEELVPRLARAGWLRLHLLHLLDAPAAHVLCAEFRGTTFAFKTSYDQARKSASPGQAVFWYALEDAFARGGRTFDFLGFESRWKAELANDARAHANLCLHSRFDAHCRWHALSETQLKPYAKEAAPSLVKLGRKLLPVRRAS